MDLIVYHRNSLDTNGFHRPGVNFMYPYLEIIDSEETCV